MNQSLIPYSVKVTRPKDSLEAFRPLLVCWTVDSINSRWSHETFEIRDDSWVRDYYQVEMSISIPEKFLPALTPFSNCVFEACKSGETGSSLGLECIIHNRVDHQIFLSTLSPNPVMNPDSP